MPPCCMCQEIPRGNDPALSNEICAFCGLWGVPPGPDREEMRKKRMKKEMRHSVYSNGDQCGGCKKYFSDTLAPYLSSDNRQLCYACLAEVPQKGGMTPSARSTSDGPTYGGARSNKGKPRFSLISSWATEGLARVLTYGAEKYTIRNEAGKVVSSGANNWRKGLSWMETIDSLERHLAEFKKGNDRDSGPEGSGLPHIDLIACNVMFLSEFQKTNNGTDDRFKAVPPVINLGSADMKVYGATGELIATVPPEPTRGGLVAPATKSNLDPSGTFCPCAQCVAKRLENEKCRSK